MPENTASAKPTKRSCQCLLGWTGEPALGSNLEMADNPGHVCDRVTRKSFAQGHDARMSSRLATEIAQGVTSADVATQLVQRAGGTAALVSKMLHSAKLRMEAAQKKATAKPATASTADDDALAENMANDEGISLNEARESLGLEPMTDDEPPALPELGSDWSVKHGKRTYKAKVIEAHTGERVASHKLGQGRDCYHDLSTGETVDLSQPVEDDDTPPF